MRSYPNYGKYQRYLHIWKITSGVGETLSAVKADGDLESRPGTGLLGKVVNAELNDAEKAGDDSNNFKYSSSHYNGRDELSWG
jgi:hypothetical protein